MPNWTDITLECEGLSSLPIFTENGNKEFDYNKVTPMPDYVRDTVSPVRENAVICYLFRTYPEKEAMSYINLYGIRMDDNLKDKTGKEIIAATDSPDYLGFGINATGISAYELGKNYVTSIQKEGVWDWYDWAYKNWGVKWNACDSYLEGDTLFFQAPWGYPDEIFRKLAQMFPDKHFHAEIRYEDDCDTIYYIDFAADYWEESSEPSSDYEE